MPHREAARRPAPLGYPARTHGPQVAIPKRPPGWEASRCSCSVLDQSCPNRDNPPTVVEGVVVEPFMGQNHLGIIASPYLGL